MNIDPLLITLTLIIAALAFALALVLWQGRRLAARLEALPRESEARARRLE